MRKKIFVFMLLCTVILSSIFAKIDYKFEVASFDPLHKEYFADSRSPEFSLNHMTYYEGFPDRVIQDEYINTSTEENKITVWDFRGDVTPKDEMIHLKIGETLGLARSTITFASFLSPIQVDYGMQGLLQQFYKGGFDDMIGYDGVYFVGWNFRIADMISMRIGNQHYCSHYGDEIFKRIQNNSNPGFDEFWITYKYVRMDNYAIGLSIEPTDSIRVYGELKYPPKDIKSCRPDMFAPNWVMRNGFYINPDYPDDYNARIVNVGFELNYPIFKKLGNTTIGYDLYLYEEGKVEYDSVNGGDITFNEDAPWEREHNIKIAQEFNNTVSVEVNYHYGRSPFNNFYFQHTEILSIGARFNPKSSFVLFDTE